MHPAVKAGLPLVILTVVGSFGLSSFVSGKNELTKYSRSSKNRSQREYEMEQEHKKIMAKLNIDAPENQDFQKRIARPDELRAAK